MSRVQVQGSASHSGPWPLTVCDGCGQPVHVAGHAGRCVPASESVVLVEPVNQEVSGMSDVEYSDWVTTITDQAHAENWGGIHGAGFCRACANVYTALNHAANQQQGAVEAIADAITYLDRGYPDDAERVLRALPARLRGQ